MTLELAGVGALVQVWPGLPGQPPRDRAALAHAFVAKAVLGLPTTSMLIERLTVDKQLRRLCGWKHPGELPSESTFSRAFAEFARSELAPFAAGSPVALFADQQCEPAVQFSMKASVAFDSIRMGRREI